MIHFVGNRHSFDILGSDKNLPQQNLLIKNLILFYFFRLMTQNQSKNISNYRRKKLIIYSSSPRKLV